MKANGLAVSKIALIRAYMDIGTGLTLTPADGAIVFCREDWRIAFATAQLFWHQHIKWAVLTGGVGKDSGTLTIPEAEHQARLLEQYGIPPDLLYLEPTAKNGAENSRRSIEVIRHRGLVHHKLILVMHPNNARRVYATHQLIALEGQGFVADYQIVTSNNPFDPTDPATQKELISELLRVADWPAKGWSEAQADLPLELVEWARHAAKL